MRSLARPPPAINILSSHSGCLPALLTALRYALGLLLALAVPSPQGTAMW